MSNFDPDKLNAFLGKVVGDVGAAMSGALVILGDRLGLYKALAERGPSTAAELARASDTSERYIQEWLDAQAASGYVDYRPSDGRYHLSPEQAEALSVELSPAAVCGLFQVTRSIWEAIDAMEQRYRTGEGYAWGDHHNCLFEGTERFFRSGYIGNLIGSWLPALDGAVERLERGATVADVGCGLGASTILMAKAFPRSKFRGFDSHAPSIELARERARAAGVADRVTFEVAKATDFGGTGYDLVAYFDCLHDMEDPIGAARHTRKALAADGLWMIVEPFANDRREDNHNPVGRVFYSASSMICVPHSLSQRGPALGAQAGYERLSKVLAEGGFTRIRTACTTPFNMVLEARG